MRKCLSVVLGSTAVVLGLSMTAQAVLPGSSARATRYDVIVTKVELCTDSSCSSALTVGSGSKTFDIASAGVGAQVGSYASLRNLPTGTTFTHVRVTIDPKIVATATGTDNSGNTCRTDSTNTASSPTAPGVAAAATAGAQTLYVPSIGGYGGGSPTANDFLIPFRITRNTSDLSILYPISSFTVTQSPPTVKVLFNTSTAIMFFDAGGGATCRVYPAPPTVSITIQ